MPAYKSAYVEHKIMLSQSNKTQSHRINLIRVSKSRQYDENQVNCLTKDRTRVRSFLSLFEIVFVRFVIPFVELILYLIVI
jgi:hypothetical protein